MSHHKHHDHHESLMDKIEEFADKVGHKLLEIIDGVNTGLSGAEAATHAIDAMDINPKVEHIVHTAEGGIDQAQTAMHIIDSIITPDASDVEHTDYM